jgi:hypothetical protein
MRKLSSIIAVATLVTLSACDRDTTGPAKPNNGTMSAVIDGAAWSAVSIAADSAVASSIIIQGSNATQTLAIAIPVDQGPGTQTVGSTTPCLRCRSTSHWWAASRTQGGAEDHAHDGRAGPTGHVRVHDGDARGHIAGGTTGELRQVRRNRSLERAD